MLVLSQKAAATSDPSHLLLHLTPPPLHLMPPLSLRICHLRPGHLDEEENDEPQIHKNMLQRCRTLPHDGWRRYSGNSVSNSKYSHASVRPAAGQTLDSLEYSGDHHILRTFLPPHLTMTLPTWNALNRK